MNHVSVFILVKNNEKTLSKCLKSVQFADEIIIILDPRSRDRSADIAKRFKKARIVKKKWMGFGKQKQFAMNLCKNHWILNLDSDEWLSRELIEEIEKIPQSTKFNAFRIPFDTYVFGRLIKRGNIGRVKKIRLFGKSKIHMNNREVHEDLVIPESSNIGELEGRIKHNTYLTVKDYLEKLQYYSSIEAELAYTSGKKVSFVDFIFRPSWSFLKSYIFQGMFLDGWQAFVLQVLTSFYQFVLIAKIFEKQKSHKNAQ